MSQAGEARTLARNGDLDGRADPVGEAFRAAEEVAGATLEQARVDAERIRVAALEEAARVRAEARAEAAQLEVKLAAMEAEIAALGQQLAEVEAQKAQNAPAPFPAQIPTRAPRRGQIVPAMSRLSWQEGDAAELSEDVILSSRERQVASVASPAMPREADAEKRRRRYEVAAARLRVERSDSKAGPRAAAERELGAAVLAASEELLSIEREHAENIDAVRANARDEAARILEAAREQATAVHMRAAESDGQQ